MLISWLIASGQVQGGARQTFRNTWSPRCPSSTGGSEVRQLARLRGLTNREMAVTQGKKKNTKNSGARVVCQNLTRTEAFSSQQLS